MYLGGDGLDDLAHGFLGSHCLLTDVRLSTVRMEAPLQSELFPAASFRTLSRVVSYDSLLITIRE